MKIRFEEYSFGKTFLVTGLIFLVIVLLLEFFYNMSQVGAEAALAILSDSKYLLRKLVGSVIYALIMTAYFKRADLKALLENRKKQ